MLQRPKRPLNFHDMDYIDYIAPIVSFITGGALLSLLTLSSQRRKAKAQAKKEEENAEDSELSNADRIVRLQTEFIVEPLKKEITKLRTDVRRLTKAINRVSDCPHADGCPVRAELQDLYDPEQPLRADPDRHPHDLPDRA